MDPDEALAKMREMVIVYRRFNVHHESVEAFAALDEWLSKGGFLPEAWQR